MEKQLLPSMLFLWFWQGPLAIWPDAYISPKNGHPKKKRWNIFRAINFLMRVPWILVELIRDVLLKSSSGVEQILIGMTKKKYCGNVYGWIFKATGFCKTETKTKKSVTLGWPWMRNCPSKKRALQSVTPMHAKLWCCVVEIEGGSFLNAVRDSASCAPI